MFGIVKRSISNSIPPSPRFLPLGKNGMDMESMSLVEEFDGFALRGEDASAGSAGASGDGSGLFEHMFER
jgi:hypothetical protein